MISRNRSESTGSDDNVASEDIPGINYQCTDQLSRSVSPMPLEQRTPSTSTSRTVSHSTHSLSSTSSTTTKSLEQSTDSERNLPILPPTLAQQQQSGDITTVTATSVSGSTIIKTQRKELTPSDFLFGITLGEGAYARVVHGRLKRPNSQDYAIKIMEKSHIKKENKVKYVMMERNILSKLSHAFIIKFHFSFQDSGYLYMCMDLAPGGELLHVINKYRNKNEEKGIENIALDEPMTRFYISELVDALEYLHSHGIIHRDIKPENILIAANGHIKVTDFGTALLETDEESTRNSFVGTAEYVSPEVLRNENVTKACDLWALGCLTYQLLCGITPFHSPSEYYTFQCILDHANGTKAVKFPSTISSIAQDLISKLLHPKSENRLGAGDDNDSNSNNNHSESNYTALKSHLFFMDIPWESLFEMTPPYIPDPSTFPDPKYLKDGADEDWIFDGEATPILPSNSRIRSMEEVDSNNNSSNNSNSPNHVASSSSSLSSSMDQRDGGTTIQKSTSQNSLNRKSSLNLFSSSHSTTSASALYSRSSSGRRISSSGSGSRINSSGSGTSICHDVSAFLDPSEKHIFTGIVLKRKGLFSKRRQLILSDKPRLLYFDPDTLEIKGTIPWTPELPVKCEVISDIAFDIVCTVTGRRYHLSAVESGSTIWVELINAMILHQQEHTATMNSIHHSNSNQSSRSYSSNDQTLVNVDDSNL